MTLAHANWSVVMTVREPRALIETNVRWHLVTGAQTVFVFFDDPHDPAADVLRAVPGCVVQVCDDAQWTAIRPNKGRPDSQMRRQTINANVAQDLCDSGWLFHIDADEFIWQDGDLRAELASLDGAGHEMNLPVLERLFPDTHPPRDLFDGPFRSAADLSDSDAALAYGAQAPFMKRGQYSHGAGKSGVAVRTGLRLGVHNATVRRNTGWRRAPKHVSRTARLLHFDGLTPLHWAMKFIRYRMTPDAVQQTILQSHRAAQIDWMMTRCATLQDVRAAHATLFALTPARRAQLDGFGLLAPVPFDPRALLGDATPDLSPDAFDADLLARNPWLRDMLDFTG